MDDSLRDEDLRRQGGRNEKGQILVTYAAPPEDVVVDYFQKSIALVGLEERSVSVPVEHGHPLFQPGLSKSGPDSKFPKIGIEWVSDRNIQSLGQNTHSFAKDKDFLEFLTRIAEQPDSHRIPNQAFLDRFSRQKHFQQFQHIVESDVVVCGFSSGQSGRIVNRWVYESALAISNLLVNDIPIQFPGISVTLPEDTEPNLSTTDFAHPLWGFELKIKIIQTRSIFRTKPDWLFPDTRRFDVHLDKSKTRLEGHFGLQDRN